MINFNCHHILFRYTCVSKEEYLKMCPSGHCQRELNREDLLQMWATTSHDLK